MLVALLHGSFQIKKKGFFDIIQHFFIEFAVNAHWSVNAHWASGSLLSECSLSIGFISTQLQITFPKGKQLSFRKRTKDRNWLTNTVIFHLISRRSLLINMFFFAERSTPSRCASVEMRKQNVMYFTCIFLLYIFLRISPAHFIFAFCMHISPADFICALHMRILHTHFACAFYLRILLARLYVRLSNKLKLTSSVFCELTIIFFKNITKWKRR